MCGIVGYAGSDSPDEGRGIVLRMADALRHRGPDGGGAWVSSDALVAFGHRRLAVVDLSPAGAQPMSSRSGRFTITFNGEVYNFRELRKELEQQGEVFRGSSDTEVMLAAFEHWGVLRSLERFVGMFAFAVWDGVERRLHLVRDRLGVKPLYYGWSGNRFAFSSELKGFWVLPHYEREILPEAAAAYLCRSYVPTPLTICKGIYKLCPGTVLTLTVDELRTKSSEFSPHADGSRQSPQSFWRLSDVVATRTLDRNGETNRNFAALLEEAVRLRMVADVPVGVFLSGGIDSSLVLALMQRASPQAVRSYSVGFPEMARNEAPFALAVARHLGSVHTEFTVTAQEARDVIPLLAGMYDEPFADSSQIPTRLISALARKEVTVALSGDGGDELCGGYERYQRAWRLWQLTRRLPVSARRLGANIIALTPQALWRFMEPAVRALFPTYLGSKRLDGWLKRIVPLLQAGSAADQYERLMQFWDTPQGWGPRTPIPDSIAASYEGYLFSDTCSYLLDDILVKVDRASMSVGLEVREPLLDHRLVECAWSLHPNERGAGGAPKKILRDILSQHLPRELYDRPKQGFRVPLEEWLRGPLREWAEELLSPNRLREVDFFDPVAIRSAWEMHQRGVAHHQDRLWVILMFQAWREHFRSVSTRGI